MTLGDLNRRWQTLTANKPPCIAIGAAPERPAGRAALWVRERGSPGLGLARRWLRISRFALRPSDHSLCASAGSRSRFPTRLDNNIVWLPCRVRAAVAVAAATRCRSLLARPRCRARKNPVPVPEKPEPVPELSRSESHRPEELTIPFRRWRSQTQLPGVIQPAAPTSRRARQAAAPGPGTAGHRLRTGLGLGPGLAAALAAAPIGPAPASRCRTVLREVKPAYTADAMRAKVQGSVWLECIVMPDGSVGEVKVTRSLDPISASIRKPSRPRRCGGSAPACARASRCRSSSRSSSLSHR